MTAFQPGYETRIYNAAFDASPYFSSADVQDEVAKLDVTAFGNTAKRYIPGIAEGAVKAAGYFSGEAGGVNAVLHSQLQTAAGQACTFYPALDTLAAAAYLLTSRTIKAGAKSAVGGMVQTDGEWVADGGVAYGVSLHAKAAETTTGGTAYVDGTAASATGWRATLHVFTVTGTLPTLDVKLQDSADHITWADVTGGAFTQAVAATGQIKISAAATTTLRRYVKIVWTIGGSGGPSFTFAAAVARHQ